ncbi:hypothetical protein J8F10_10160 [Gemmata sp. G18]|uniref:Uncharacterized protein n=1 Tax=Gemmata palustris TaxID=2822762 RepID=A0ABS5BPM3_9BACT|nr:hypothetical protein [Gemmata palustris]MBP3955643.1 hypothetical protein [Gemmata palustris]
MRNVVVFLGTVETKLIQNPLCFVGIAPSRQSSRELLADADVVLEALVHSRFGSDFYGADNGEVDRVSIAHMQTSAAEDVSGELVFQIRGLRKLELPLAVSVCEQETAEGKAKGINCVNCTLCWRPL